jgi:hypothetical protein
MLPAVEVVACRVRASGALPLAWWSTRSGEQPGGPDRAAVAGLGQVVLVPAEDQRFLMLRGPSADQRPHPYQAHSRDAFMLLERETASASGSWS